MNERHLLLINPPIYDFAAYDLWAKPLGLLYLAGVLERNGWVLHYLDCLDVHHSGLGTAARRPKRKSDHRGHFVREEMQKPLPLSEIPRRFYRFGLSSDDLTALLSSLPPVDAVLVTSGMTYWYLGVHEVIRTIREFGCNAPVILGGIYATVCRDHAAGFSGADVIVEGRGETEVLRVLEEICGVSPVWTPDMGDLDGLPYPAFYLYPQLDYVCVMATRGCPFRCSYCASWRLQDGFSVRDPMAVAWEIGHWIRTNHVEDIAFYDDALLADHGFASSLCEALLRTGVRARFHTPNGLHVRSLDRDLARLLREVGFTTIRLGLETASPDRQVRTGNKVTNDQFADAVDALRLAGYRRDALGTYVLVGLPGQTSQEVADTIRFVWECGARPHLAEYSPIPGTDLWPEAVAGSSFDLKGEPLYHNNTILPCRWDGLTWQDLRRLKDMVRTLPVG
jgi:radical SAM superfamily enzyme YgiQ (UPF0313 family)